MSKLHVSLSQIEHYNKAGPRYTSYPTVPNWSAAFDELAYGAALAEVAARPDEALSVYVHLPFCAHRCAYCGCNATVTRHSHVVDAYLDRVERELALVAPRLGGRRAVAQLHWGGGTPNFLNAAQTQRLYGLLASTFAIEPDGEVALEIDPRIGTPAQLALYRALGFNRVSFGVQDIDPAVQVAIDRIQPFAQTERLFMAARELGFESINLDLVYGLPYQTAEVFARTLAAISGLGPDRLACFSYAHLPNSLKNQKRVDAAGLPTPYAKFELFQQAVETLTDAGYDWIGMDHFARATDELSVAARERRLHRNFMGYTLRPAQQLLGLGTSAIGDLGNCFVQNDASLGRYQKAIDAGRLPIVRGHRLSADDQRRRTAITHLMCNLELPLAITEYDEALIEAVARLAGRADEGLVSFDGERILVTELGRYFVRNLCMELDAYLGYTVGRPMFSRTI